MNRKLLIGTVAACIVVALAGSYFFVTHRPAPASGTAAVTYYEKKIGRHVALPTNETPALATVTDPSRLGNNKFLSNGRKGDKILIYAKWQRAVLYRPSVDRVIDIGPVDISSPDKNSTDFQPLSK